MSDELLAPEERRAWRRDLARSLGSVADVPPLDHLMPSPKELAAPVSRHWMWWGAYGATGLGVVLAAVWTIALNPRSVPQSARLGSTAAVRRDLQQGTPLEVTEGPLRVLIIPLKAPVPEDVIRVLYPSRRLPMAFSVKWGSTRVKPLGRGAVKPSPRLEAGSVGIPQSAAPKPGVPLRIQWRSYGLRHSVTVPLTQARALTARNRRTLVGQKGAYWNAQYVEETVAGPDMHQRIGQLFVQSIQLSSLHQPSYALSVAGTVQTGAFTDLWGTADWSEQDPASSYVITHPSVSIYQGKKVLARIPLHVGREANLPDTIPRSDIRYAPLSSRPGFISAHQAEVDAQHVPGVRVGLTHLHARLAKVQMPLYHGPAWLVTGSTSGDGPEAVVINAGSGQPVESVLVPPGSTGKSGKES